MDQSKTTKDAGLEAQLRGMILGNVRIGGDQNPQEGQRSQRGRGRGRGGIWRGGNRDQQVRPMQNDESPASANSPSAPRRGGRAGYQHNGYRQTHQAPSVPHNQQAAAPLSQSTTGESVQNAPRLPRQQNYGQPQHFNNSISYPQSPKIMQRQHIPNDRSTHGQMNTGQVQGAHPRFNQQPREDPSAQTEHLDMVAAQEIPKVEMSLPELEEKEAFRQRLEGILKQYFAEHYSGDVATISLMGFGSLASGFGIPGSDMDLAVVPDWKDPSKLGEVDIDRDIPRLLEQAVLDAQMGGRLLTRTRVPILKVCQSPPEALYTALCDERRKWNELPEEEKYPTEVVAEPATQPKSMMEADAVKPFDNVDSPSFDDSFPAIGAAPKKKAAPKTPKIAEQQPSEPQKKVDTPPAVQPEGNDEAKANSTGKEPQARAEKAWMREKVLGPLDFPKTGCGIQCDLNFGNPLGIHNTHMLRCYSLTDPRVRPIVLFVKSWAKRRKINSAYSGTLSSYGWVLMVLHYLVNIARPPVCPNLQHAIPQPKDVTQLESFFKDTVISGYAVRYWRNEGEILHAAHSGQLSQNRQTVGGLLRGFFQYYASLSGYGPGPRPPQFYWTSEVLSLRTPGGIRSKQEKGWVSAKTTITAEKKVTNRYLFAIEDPFELDHNVARTVTHRGIVAIRDEFRRAWRILVAIGRSQTPEGGLFDEVVEIPPALAVKDDPDKEEDVKKAEVQGVVSDTKGSEGGKMKEEQV